MLWPLVIAGLALLFLIVLLILWRKRRPTISAQRLSQDLAQVENAVQQKKEELSGLLAVKRDADHKINSLTEREIDNSSREK